MQLLISNPKNREKIRELLRCLRVLVKQCLVLHVDRGFEGTPAQRRNRELSGKSYVRGTQKCVEARLLPSFTGTVIAVGLAWMIWPLRLLSNRRANTHGLGRRHHRRPQRRLSQRCPSPGRLLKRSMRDGYLMRRCEPGGDHCSPHCAQRRPFGMGWLMTPPRLEHGLDSGTTRDRPLASCHVPSRSDRPRPFPSSRVVERAQGCLSRSRCGMVSRFIIAWRSKNLARNRLRR
jgi:hypothetical protein